MQNNHTATLAPAPIDVSRWRKFPCHYIRDGKCSCGDANCESPGKHPLPHDGLKSATNDAAQVEKWWRVNPQANLAITTGEENELVVIDVDADSGGFETLLEIEEHYGLIPETVEARTGGGGRHLYLRYPKGHKIGSRNGWMQGIDIKANGGYVICPPSRNGKGSYSWEPGQSPADIPIADIPDWLLPLLPRQSREQAPRTNGANSFTIQEGSASLLHRAKHYVATVETADEGTRNEKAFGLAGNVFALDEGGRRLSETEIFDVMTPWNARNNPPLSDRELQECIYSAIHNGTPRPAKETDYRNNPAEASIKGPIEYKRITSAELAAGDYRVDYLIEHTLVAGQPLIVAGPQKTLKTSLLVDAAVSLSTAGFFLGKLKVNRKCRVAVMSGECGLATIQETARRVCDAAGRELGELDSIIWSPDIPKFGSASHLDALEKFLTADAIEALLVDPAYLAMPSNDAGNLMAQGELLRGMNELCQRLGVTLGLCHHAKKNTGRDPFEPMELQDIAWAGFAEFARQWWLLNRREKYEPGTGEHKLWLSVGGSAGHSALWALDVSEGTIADPGGRHWDVSIAKPDEARQEAEQRKQEAKAGSQAKQLEADTQAVVKALAKRPGTKTDIRDRSGLRGSRLDSAMAELLTNGELENATIIRDNGHEYPGYKLQEKTC